MKRLLVMMLALAMCLGLAGCGDSSGNSTSVPNPSEETSSTYTPQEASSPDESAATGIQLELTAEENGYIYYDVYIGVWNNDYDLYDIAIKYSQQAIDMGIDAGYSISKISVNGYSSDGYHSFYNTANNITLKEYSSSLGWKTYEYKAVLKY